MYFARGQILRPSDRRTQDDKGRGVEYGDGTVSMSEAARRAVEKVGT
jgi:hypothetical protein